MDYFCGLKFKNKNNMEATAIREPLNEAQLFVLKTFSTVRNAQEKEELTSLYLDYIQKKLDAATDKWWKDNEMTDEKMKEILNTHYRTPYK
jgi:hypothetical protein